MPSHRRPPARSLESLEPGERAWVSGIIGRETLTRCREMDLFEGDRVVCLRATRDEIVLEQKHGAIVHLDRTLARRIEVAADESARSGGGDGSVSRAGASTGPAPQTTGDGREQRRPDIGI